MSTIVSAFVCVNVDTRSDLDLEGYYHHGKKLMQSTTPKIIFIDKKMALFVKKDDYDAQNTDIVEIEYENFLHSHLYKITHYHPNTDNPGKDTLPFMLMTCHKTEFLRKAIERNTFKTTNFVWVDFGIHKIVREQTIDFLRHLDKIGTWQGDRLRVGRIWDLDRKLDNPEKIYTEIHWFFAGGVFAGPSALLLVFADIMRNKCIQIINTRKTIMWEVNVWYLIYKDYKLFFDPYPCNHDMSLLSNF
jgi:hypothetical protein